MDDSFVFSFVVKLLLSREKVKRVLGSSVWGPPLVGFIGLDLNGGPL